MYATAFMYTLYVYYRNIRVVTLNTLQERNLPRVVVKLRYGTVRVRMHASPRFCM